VQDRRKQEYPNGLKGFSKQQTHQNQKLVQEKARWYQGEDKKCSERLNFESSEQRKKKKGLDKKLVKAKIASRKVRVGGWVESPTKPQFARQDRE